MDETAQSSEALETDHRFPSGPWTGYFLQREIPGRHWMEIEISFRAGHLRGTGFDWVGPFHLIGTYHVEDGRCYLTKRYFLRHDVAYEGYNEGRGIWGKWEIPALSHGGFHIWPKSMADPTGSHLREEADLPRFVSPFAVESEDPVVQPSA